MTAGELLPEPLSNGTGCDDATITQIVDELKRRIEIRGNIGQMKKLEAIMEKVDDLRLLMTVLQHELGVDTTYPPSQSVMSQLYGQTPLLPPIRPHAKPSEQFPMKEYDEPDKQIYKSVNCIGDSVNSMPYAQISSVDEERDCWCLRSVNGMMPGCGCSGNLVTEVGSHPDNLHLTSEGPLLKMEKKIVPKEALALQYHDRDTEAATMILPPTMGAPAVAIAQPKWEAVRDLAGSGGGYGPSVVNTAQAEVSLTAPGEPALAAGTAQSGQVVYAQRRSLEQRRGEHLADAAVADRWVLKVLALPIFSDGFAQALKRSPLANLALITAMEAATAQKALASGYQLKRGAVKPLLESVKLHLGEEEVTMTKKNCCGTHTMRMPYAQLGSVDMETCCCGKCYNVETDGGAIAPACGCDKEITEAISDELQKRKVTRGNIAQVQMQENLMIEVIKMNVQLDQLAKKENVAYPPDQATMEKVFGPGAQVPGKWSAPIMAIGGGDPTIMQVKLGSNQLRAEFEFNQDRCSKCKALGAGLFSFRYHQHKRPANQESEQD
eukprot:g15574.t1